MLTLSQTEIIHNRVKFELGLQGINHIKRNRHDFIERNQEFRIKIWNSDRDMFFVGNTIEEIAKYISVSYGFFYDGLYEGTEYMHDRKMEFVILKFRVHYLNEQHNSN